MLSPAAEYQFVINWNQKNNHNAKHNTNTNNNLQQTRLVNLQIETTTKTFKIIKKQV